MLMCQLYLQYLVQQHLYYQLLTVSSNLGVLVYNIHVWLEGILEYLDFTHF